MKKKNIVTLSIALNTFRENVKEDPFVKQEVMKATGISDVYFSAMVGPIFTRFGKGLYKIRPELVHTQINQMLINTCFESVRKYKREYLRSRKIKTEQSLQEISSIDSLIDEVKNLREQLAKYGVRVTIERQVSTWETIE